jgi:hypothetical protein
MTKMMRLNRWSISIACCSVFLLSAIALAFSVKTEAQQTQDSRSNEKSEIARQVEASPDQPLRILGNDDCPLKLVEANVKEVPAALFTKLTGQVTDLPNVSTVPEATLVNTSGQTVTRFFLVVRDPDSSTTRVVVQNEIALKPGDSYKVTRDHFAEAKRVTTTGEDGRTQHRLIMAGMDSEKKWIQFASRSAIFITVAKVEFNDGSSWTVTEGGEVR